MGERRAGQITSHSTKIVAKQELKLIHGVVTAHVVSEGARKRCGAVCGKVVQVGAVCVWSRAGAQPQSAHMAVPIICLIDRT